MKIIRHQWHPQSFSAIALFLGALTLNAGAQSPPSSAPEERLLQPDSVGSPRMELVIPSEVTGDAVALGIFLMGRVPIGFEGVYEGSLPPAGGTRFDMTGATVGEALGSLVRTDPRYLWQVTNDVIVVRPLLASADPDNLLNQPVRDIDWQDVPVEQALVNVRRLIHGSSNVPSTIPGSAHESRLLSVQLRSGSVLDVLNAIVRAHGALMWSVVYIGRERPGVVQTGPHVGFRWIDGHGIGGAPVRRQTAKDARGARL